MKTVDRAYINSFEAHGGQVQYFCRACAIVADSIADIQHDTNCVAIEATALRARTTALEARAETAEATVVVLMAAIQKYFSATPDEMVETIVALKNAANDALTTRGGEATE